MLLSQCCPNVVPVYWSYSYTFIFTKNKHQPNKLVPFLSYHDAYVYYRYRMDQGKNIVWKIRWCYQTNRSLLLLVVIWAAKTNFLFAVFCYVFYKKKVWNKPATQCTAVCVQCKYQLSKFKQLILVQTQHKSNCYCSMIIK